MIQRKKRLPILRRLEARIARLGHCVLKFEDGDGAVRWLKETLGMLVTDRLYLPEDKSKSLGTFMRVNRGDKPADHHTIFALQAMPGDINVHHTSYEVQDPDAVHIGHKWLASKGYLQEWGVGRHLLGSQVFDYWQDPWGRVHEHWTDTDVLNSKNAPQKHSAEDGLNSQWGQPAPEEFIAHCSP